MNYDNIEISEGSWGSLTESAPPKSKTKVKRTKKEIIATLPKNCQKNEQILFLDVNQTIQHWDVFGLIDNDRNRVNDGMIIARYNEKCPVWLDKLKWKSMTLEIPKKVYKNHLDEILSLLSKAGYLDFDMETKLANGNYAVRVHYNSIFG